MKANELMIGDYVKFLGRVRKIKSIISKDTGIEISFEGENPVVVSLDEIEPIHLTPEILEKNGFECRGAWCLPGEDMGLRQDGDTWGVLSHYGMYTSIPFCRISYIHQLQNALRLCEISKEIEL